MAVVEKEDYESRELKHLGFVRIAAIQTLVCVSNLYEYAKQNSGLLRSTVGTVEGVVTAVVGPVYKKFKGVPDDFLAFLDTKVDEATDKFNKHAPPLAKQVASKGHCLVLAALDKGQRLVREAQTGGPRSAIHYAATESKQLVFNQSVKLWVVLDQYHPIHKVAEKAAPTAAHLSEKYNHTVKDLTVKGYPIFSYLPLVPVDDISRAVKQGKAGKKGDEAAYHEHKSDSSGDDSSVDDSSGDEAAHHGYKSDDSKGVEAAHHEHKSDSKRDEAAHKSDSKGDESDSKGDEAAQSEHKSDSKGDDYEGAQSERKSDSKGDEVAQLDSKGDEAAQSERKSDSKGDEAAQLDSKGDEAAQSERKYDSKGDEAAQSERKSDSKGDEAAQSERKSDSKGDEAAQLDSKGDEVAAQSEHKSDSKRDDYEAAQSERKSDSKGDEAAQLDSKGDEAAQSERKSDSKGDEVAQSERKSDSKGDEAAHHEHKYKGDEVEHLVLIED